MESYRQHWLLKITFGNVEDKTEAKPTKTTTTTENLWKFNETQKKEIYDFLSITSVLTLTLESLLSEPPARSWNEKKRKEKN